MDKKDLLQHVDFGDSVAEAETQHLKRYFVETDQWQKVHRGEIDIIDGPKGFGKSAMYALLQDQAESFSARSITFVQAENPQGATAFQQLLKEQSSPSREDFVELWKLYFLSVLGEKFVEGNIKNEHATFVLQHLQASGLL